MVSQHGPGCGCTVCWSSEMTTAIPSHHALARWLVTTELGDAEEVLLGPAAAERVFRKLSQRLAQLITPVGSEALLGRALQLSRVEFPFLDGVHAMRNTDPLIERLGQAAASVKPSQAHEGFVVVLGTLLALLVSFIGENLTLRVLREVWPELPMVQPVQPIRQNGTGNVEMTT
jgi:hypothetical protein